MRIRASVKAILQSEIRRLGLAVSVGGMRRRLATRQSPWGLFVEQGGRPAPPASRIRKLLPCDLIELAAFVLSCATQGKVNHLNPSPRIIVSRLIQYQNTLRMFIPAARTFCARLSVQEYTQKLPHNFKGVFRVANLQTPKPETRNPKP